MVFYKLRKVNSNHKKMIFQNQGESVENFLSLCTTNHKKLDGEPFLRDQKVPMLHKYTFKSGLNAKMIGHSL